MANGNRLGENRGVFLDFRVLDYCEKEENFGSRWREVDDWEEFEDGY